MKKQTEKGKDPASLTEESWKKSLAKLSLTPVAKRLGELLGQDVLMAADVVGPDAQAKAASLQPGQILLLENTRFEKGETKNDPELAKQLASMADLYVSDAFGAVHRAHASTAGVAAYLPAVSGFLIQKELEFLGGAIADPRRPLVAILGGSKVSSKIGVINNLLNIADTSSSAAAWPTPSPPPRAARWATACWRPTGSPTPTTWWPRPPRRA